MVAGGEDGWWGRRRRRRLRRRRRGRRLRPRLWQWRRRLARSSGREVALRRARAGWAARHAAEGRSSCRRTTRRSRRCWGERDSNRGLGLARAAATTQAATGRAAERDEKGIASSPLAPNHTKCNSPQGTRSAKQSILATSISLPLAAPRQRAEQQKRRPERPSVPSSLFPSTPAFRVVLRPSAPPRARFYSSSSSRVRGALKPAHRTRQHRRAAPILTLSARARNPSLLSGREKQLCGLVVGATNKRVDR